MFAQVCFSRYAWVPTNPPPAPICGAIYVHVCVDIDGFMCVWVIGDISPQKSSVETEDGSGFSGGWARAHTGPYPPDIPDLFFP